MFHGKGGEGLGIRGWDVVRMESKSHSLIQPVFCVCVFHAEMATLFRGHLGKTEKSSSSSGMTSCNTTLAFDVGYVRM